MTGRDAANSVVMTSGTAATVLLLGLAVGPVGAQSSADAWTVAPEEVEAARDARLFRSDDVLELTLYADFHSIRRDDRDDDASERPALLHVAQDGDTRTLELKVRTRGNWRRAARNCAFPPLWLDFDKDDESLDGTVFEGQNRLKLYVTCRPGREDFERYVYTEYVIYPAYNALTEASFRARPARVTYVDTSGEDEPFTSPAFVLEHKSQMAARNEGVAIDDEQLHPASVGQEHAALMELFNYLVGMTDYSGVLMHNVEPIRRADGTLVPVSYDFDWSGTVDARYARPDPSLPIRDVRERVFRGFCREIDYAPVFQRFLDRRDDMMDAVRGFGGLAEDARVGIVEYWDAFFELIDTEDGRARILRDCKEMPR